MSNEYVISDIMAAEILDSRGVPTVACQLRLQTGAVGFMQVPSGASTGQYEATELRDGDSTRYFSKGVLQAIWNIESYIKPRLLNQGFQSLSDFDHRLCDLDGTKQKSHLGANALLAVSGAFARAAAMAQGLPLYRFFSATANCLPVPFMNVLNGGRHANNNLAIQEFMLVPHRFGSFRDAIRAGAEVSQYLGEILKARYGCAGRGDEGGFAPKIDDAREALDAIVQAIERSAFSIDQIGVALDMAASEYHNSDGYFSDKQASRVFNSDKWVDYISALVDEYPILSIEDLAADNDVGTWQQATQRLNHRVQIVGDDVFVTQSDRLQQGIHAGVANAILLKPNQVGTLSETMATLKLASENQYKTIISHRSGETEDALIADFAVGGMCQQIKTGALRQSDRLSKYNRLLWIERELEGAARFPSDLYQSFRRKSIGSEVS